MSSAYSSRPQGSRTADLLGSNAQLLSIAGFFLIMVVIFSIASPVFLSTGNILNLVRQIAPILIVATAMTFVITTGGIDLSVGSVVALVNASAAILLQAGLPWPLAVIGLILLGAAIGAMQGWFIAYQGIQAFIVTLAGLSALRGIALLMTEGFSIPISTDLGFVSIGRGWFLGVPAPTWLALIVAVLGFIVFRSTRFGRYVTAIGANQEAARRSGIATRRTILWVYVLTGIASAVAGIVIAARLGSGSSNAAVGFELEVIAAVVLGGTSLRARLDLRHRAGRAHYRGDRQWADPRPCLALLHPDRDRCHHPARRLAQCAGLLAPDQHHAAHELRTHNA